MINGNFKIIYGVNCTLAVSTGTKKVQQSGHQMSTEHILCARYIGSPQLTMAFGPGISIIK